MASQNLLEFNAANFDEQVLKSTTPVVVDFWAEWCGPCRALTPKIEKVATDYVERIRVGKVDVDANHAIAVKYGIENIPTVILFKNGQIARKFVGIPKEPDFKQALDALL